MKTIDENYFSDPSNMGMNSIEDIIDKNEKILLKLRPNKKAHIWAAVLNMLPLALLWLGFDSIFIYFMFAGIGTIPTFVTIFMGVFLLFHLMPVWIWIAGIVKAVLGYKNIEYVFTDKRIIVRSGVVGIDFKSVYYSDIEGVNVKVGLSDRIFKVGDIYIKANMQSIVLWDISNPYMIMARLQKIALDIKTDINFPNDLRPEENHGYNTKYAMSSESFGVKSYEEDPRILDGNKRKLTDVIAERQEKLKLTENASSENESKPAPSSIAKKSSTAAKKSTTTKSTSNKTTSKSTTAKKTTKSSSDNK